MIIVLLLCVSVLGLEEVSADAWKQELEAIVIFYANWW